MKFIVIDFQAFNTPAVTVKELAIFDGETMHEYLFQAPKPLYAIEDQGLLKQIRFLQAYHHCLKYSSGHVPYGALDEILNLHLQGVHRIYVKGAIKEGFLRDKVPHSIEIINVEYLEDCPKFEKQITCMNHIRGIKCICSKNNCKTLYAWIISFLPK